jgi:hypothetical protein
MEGGSGNMLMMSKRKVPGALDVSAREIQKIADREEMRELIKPFFREFGIATWALLVGVALGFYIAWAFFQVSLAKAAGLTYLASVGVVFTLGASSAVVLWLALKLIWFAASRRK